MNLDELEQFREQKLQEGVCELGGKKDDEEWVAVDDDTPVALRLLDECVEKVLKHLYGKNWDTAVKEKSRKKIREIISKSLQLEVIEQTENDLGETLDLLEDSLFLMERIMARASYHNLSTEMINHMESVADHLGQWNMGDSKKAESRALTDKQVADITRDRFRD